MLSVLLNATDSYYCARERALYILVFGLNEEFFFSASLDTILFCFIKTHLFRYLVLLEFGLSHFLVWIVWVARRRFSDTEFPTKIDLNLINM